MASAFADSKDQAAASAAAAADTFDGSNDSDELLFVMYKDRPEWSDVKPVAQIEPSLTLAPVVSIDYSDKFRDVYDYFRGVMEVGDKSHRVLELTADAIGLNAANYTVWQYRRDVLQALQIPHYCGDTGSLNPEFSAEFQFSKLQIDENQKNYQVWHHRKILVAWAAGCMDETKNIDLSSIGGLQFLKESELELTLEILKQDAKNYHAWQHRQWIVAAFRCFDEELKYIESLLEEDVRNNSAWNQQFFVISKFPITKALIESEVLKTFNLCVKCPSNESSWTYLEGILRLCPEVNLGNCDGLFLLCSNLHTKDEIKSVPMLGFLLNLYEARLKLGKIDGAMAFEYLNSSTAICDFLISDLDKIRKGYWNMIKGNLINVYESKYGQLPMKN